MAHPRHAAVIRTGPTQPSGIDGPPAASTTPPATMLNIPTAMRRPTCSRKTSQASSAVNTLSRLSRSAAVDAEHEPAPSSAKRALRPHPQRSRCQARASPVRARDSTPWRPVAAITILTRRAPPPSRGRESPPASRDPCLGGGALPGECWHRRARRRPAQAPLPRRSRTSRCRCGSRQHLVAWSEGAAQAHVLVGPHGKRREGAGRSGNGGPHGNDLDTIHARSVVSSQTCVKRRCCHADQGYPEDVEKRGCPAGP